MSDEILENLDNLETINQDKCARCGVAITHDNDSGWEAIVGDGTQSQPLCKPCNEKDSRTGGKMALCEFCGKWLYTDGCRSCNKNTLVN